MELKEILTKAFQLGGSDIFIVPGAPVTAKVKGKLVNLTDAKILPADSEVLVREAYDLARRDFSILRKEGDDDFSFTVMQMSRFRCNA